MLVWGCCCCCCCRLFVCLFVCLLLFCFVLFISICIKTPFDTQKNKQTKKQTLPMIVQLTPKFFPTLRLIFILPQPSEFVYNLTFRQLGLMLRAFPTTLYLLISLLGLFLHLLLDSISQSSKHLKPTQNNRHNFFLCCILPMPTTARFLLMALNAVKKDLKAAAEEGNFQSPSLCRLPDNCSIYTAELHAVRLALKLICQSKKKAFLVLSDSLSVLKSIANLKCDHPPS